MESQKSLMLRIPSDPPSKYQIETSVVRYHTAEYLGVMCLINDQIALSFVREAAGARLYDAGPFQYE